MYFACSNGRYTSVFNCVRIQVTMVAVGINQASRGSVDPSQLIDLTSPAWRRQKTSRQGLPHSTSLWTGTPTERGSRASQIKVQSPGIIALYAPRRDRFKRDSSSPPADSKPATTRTGNNYARNQHKLNTIAIQVLAELGRHASRCAIHRYKCNNNDHHNNIIFKINCSY